MAYKKRYYKKKVNTVSKKVDNLTKEINKLKPEIKYWTTADAPTGALWLSNGFSFDISQVPLGTSSQERIGQKIRMHKLTGKLYFATGSITLLRYQIVVAKAPMGASLNYQYVNDSLHLLANYNMDNAPQYRVLRDVTFPVDPNNPNKIHKFSIDLKGMVQDFTVGDATSKNEIRLILISDDASEELGTNYAFSTKLTYTDD